MDLRVTSNNYQPGFKGYISKASATQFNMNEAIEYASRFTRSEKRREEVRQFFNTLKLIKNDGTNNEFKLETLFKIDKRGFSTEGKWIVKYGSYLDEQPYNYNMSFAESNKAAFNKVLKFGKKFFGLEKINKPLPEFRKADSLYEQSKALQDIAEDSYHSSVKSLAEEIVKE